MRKLLMTAAAAMALMLDCTPAKQDTHRESPDAPPQAGQQTVNQLSREVEAMITNLFNPDSGSACGEIFFRAIPGAFPGKPVWPLKTSVDYIRVAAVDKPMCGKLDNTKQCTVVFNQYDQAGNAIGGFSVTAVCLAPEDVAGEIRRTLETSGCTSQLNLDEVLGKRILLQE